MGKPSLFIGSSRESLPLAKRLRRRLERGVAVALWSDPGFFDPNKSALATLVEKLPLFDFAVLILGEDDRTTSRGKQSLSPRDNVVFELGLCMGFLGPGRAFYLNTGSAKLPTDLSGITSLYYKPGARGERSIRGVSDTILRETRRQSRLPLRLVGLDDWHLSWLAREVLEAAMVGPNRTAYKNDSDFISALSDAIAALAPTATVRAVCAAKRWGQGALTNYIEENRKAADRGVITSRLFLEPLEGGFDPATSEVIAMHQGDRMKALRIPPRDAERLSSDYSLPDAFGFAVLGETVFIHRGFQGQGGFSFTHPMVVARYRKLYEDLARWARPFPAGQ